MKRQLFALLFLAAFLSFAHAIPNNPMAYYTWPGISALGTDSSGNGFTLTNNSNVLYGLGRVGLPGNSILNGNTTGNLSGDYRSALATSQNFSIDLWYKGNGTKPGSGLTSDFFYTNIQVTNVLYAIVNSTGGLDFDVKLTSGGETHIFQPNLLNQLSAGNWHNLYFDFNGTALNLYVDGVYNASTATAATTTAFGGVFRYYVGSDYTLGGHLIGEMDDMAIYNRSLTASEINALANPPSAALTFDSQTLLSTGNYNVSFNSTINSTGNTLQTCYISANATYNVSLPCSGSNWANHTAFQIQPGSYNITLWANDSASNTITAGPISLSLFDIYNFTIFDEMTQAKIWANITQTNTTGTFFFAPGSYPNFTLSILSGVTTFSFNNASFYIRGLYYAFPQTTSQSIYLLNQSYNHQISLNVLVRDTIGNPIPNALVTFNKTINGNNVVLDQEITSASGTAGDIVDCLQPITLQAIATGYTSRSGSVSLDCFASNNVVIPLQANIGGQTFQQPYQNMSYVIFPQTQIYDPWVMTGVTTYDTFYDLQYYNLTLWYGNGSGAFYMATDTSNSGGTLQVNISKDTASPNYTLMLTHKSIWMSQEYSQNFTITAYSFSNSSVPVGLDATTAKANFSPFALIIIPLILISILAGLSGVAGGYQGGLGIILVAILGIFAWWGWLAPAPFGLIAIVAVAVSYLYSRSG